MSVYLMFEIIYLFYLMFKIVCLDVSCFRLYACLSACLMIEIVCLNVWCLRLYVWSHCWNKLNNIHAYIWCVSPENVKKLNASKTAVGRDVLSRSIIMSKGWCLPQQNPPLRIPCNYTYCLVAVLGTILGKITLDSWIVFGSAPCIFLISFLRCT